MSESEAEDQKETASDEQDAEGESESQEQADESEQESASESESESESESKPESDTETESESTEASESSTEESESESDDESEADDTGTTEPAAVDTGDTDADNTIEGILAIRQSVEATAGSLIGHKFDGVSEIEATDDGWRSVVEVVERKSIPDTQDVIGRYEVDLDEEGVIEGYSRLNRYRRGDTTVFE